MFAVLVVLAFAIVTTGFYRRNLGLRESLLYATIPLSLFLVFSTESLSAFHAITKTFVALAWVVAAGLGFLWSTRQRGLETTRPTVGQVWGELGQTERLMLAGLGVVAALVLVTSILSAPNTWDAMEYHMPRVVEWIGNRGVQLYPTIDRQQLSMPPFSEYAILHLQLLFGSDRLANLVQWLTFVGCMAAASLIARELGGDKKTQVLAAVVSGTIETGILGASGAKNDYTLAYWVAVAVVLLLQWRKQQSWTMTLAIAATLSLAVFSKGTGYAFLPPFVVFCFFLWDAKAKKTFLMRLPILALVLVMVTGPLWVRNHAYSGSVLGLPYFDGAGPNEGRLYGNAHLTPTRTVANVIRNVALNLAVPSGKMNGITVKVFSKAISALGVDPNDYYQLVHAQSGELPPFNVEFRPFSETQSGNQLHFLVLLGAGVLCLWKWRSFDRSVVLLGCGIVGSFVLYAMLLRWSPWNARYQLPVFVVGAAFSAVVLMRMLPKIAPTIAVAMLLLACVIADMNSSRPLLGRSYSVIKDSRDKTYFFDHHFEFADSFIDAAKAAVGKDCNSIGIDGNLMHFEYPMMALLNKDGKQRRLTYVSVKNPTAEYKTDAAAPCTVVCLNCAHSQEKLEEYQGQFQSAETYGDIMVFAQMPQKTQSDGH